MKIHPTQLVITIAGLTSLILILTGCTGSSSPYTPIPSGAQTISQIYEKHHNIQFLSMIPPHFPPDDEISLHAYTRHTYNELSALFPRLPNPSFILYIFPHLSVEGAPVPGYSTVFEMYETVEYALPGEN